MQVKAYEVKCHECRETLRYTDSVGESARGGTCESCINPDGITVQTDFVATPDQYGHILLLPLTGRAHSHVQGEVELHGDEAAVDGKLFVENRCWDDVRESMRDEGWDIHEPMSVS